MPELPEVEHLRRRLERRIVGARISRVEVRRDDILARGTALTPGQRSGATAIAGALRQRVLIGFGRHGKLLSCSLDDGTWLLIHLGMSGQVLVADHEDALPQADHLHLVLHLASVVPLASDSGDPGASAASGERRPNVLVFRDPRRFGGILHWATSSMPMPWGVYGPDALTGQPPSLEVTPERFSKATPNQNPNRLPNPKLESTSNAPVCPLPVELWIDRFAGSKAPLKAALLDQRRFAGIGNIYADEILHRARLHPMRPAGLLKRPQWQRMADSTAAIFDAAIRAGGSTIRDYLDADQQPGRFALQHLVYGRGGQPCRECGRRLRLDVVGGRATVYCTRCQPRAAC